jgi:hypothetical protein
MAGCIPQGIQGPQIFHFPLSFSSALEFFLSFSVYKQQADFLSNIYHFHFHVIAKNSVIQPHFFRKKEIRLYNLAMYKRKRELNLCPEAYAKVYVDTHR